MSPRASTLVLVGTLCLPVLAGGVRFLLARPTGPVLDVLGPPTVTELDEKIAMVDGRRTVSKQRIEFVLANTGRQDLLLEIGATSCACAGIRLQDKLVPPGRRTSAFLDVVPPQLGEKLIRAELRTNVKHQPVIILEHRVVGDAKPPFPIAKSPFIELPSSVAPGDSLPVVFNTVEARGSKPWITRVDCDRPFLRAELIDVDDSEAPRQDSTNRTYRISLNVISPVPAGFVDGRLAVVSTDEQTVYQFLLRGHNEAHLRAVPSSFWIPKPQSDSLITKKVIIRRGKDSHGTRVEAEQPAVPWIQVQPRKEGDDIDLFLITVDPGAMEAVPAEAVLRFSLSDLPEDSTSVRVVVGG